MFFLTPSKPALPARIPAGLPANFKGVPTGGAQLNAHIQNDGGNVAFDHLGSGIGAMRMDVLKRIKRGIWGAWFFKFDSYDPPEKANKFTLRGCINFTGDYPDHLTAKRR
jgi:hypothetical protein